MSRYAMVCIALLFATGCDTELEQGRKTGACEARGTGWHYANLRRWGEEDKGAWKCVHVDSTISPGSLP